MNIKTKYCIGDIIHVIDFDMDDKVYVANSYIVNDIVVKLEDGNTNIYYNNDYNENSCWDNIHLFPLE